MIELKILLDNLDYDSVADFLIPLVAENMAKEQKGGILGGVLASNPDMAAAMARTVLRKMNQDKKDELLVELVNKNRDKLLEKGMVAAGEKGVHVQLCDVSARKF